MRLNVYWTFIKASTDCDFDESITDLNNKINDETKRAIKLLQEDEQRKKHQESRTTNTVTAFNECLATYFKKID